MLASILLLCGTAWASWTGAGSWGNDINAGDGLRLVNSVRPELLRIVQASAAQPGRSRHCWGREKPHNPM